MIKINLHSGYNFLRASAANDYIIKKYNLIPDLNLRDDLWLIEFNCRIERDDQTWTYLTWERDEDYTHFLLKFD